MARLGWRDFLKKIEEWIVGTFVDSLVAEKVFEKLRLLVVANKKTAAVGTIKKDYFWYKIYYFATIDLAVAVANLQW